MCLKKGFDMSKKMISWLFGNFSYLFLVVLWGVTKNTGLYVGLAILTVLMLIVTFFLLQDKVMDILLQKKVDFESAVPLYVDICFDLIVTLLLIYYGATGLGLVYFLHIVFYSKALAKFKAKKSCWL